MAKIALAKASTNVTQYVFIQDSSATTGAGLTGLVYNSAGLVCYYVRPLAAAAALTLATQTVTGAHSDGGFVEVDATNMPGVYRLDLSDAICATGVDSVVVMLKGATNMAPVVLEIQLTDFNLNDATPAVDVTTWNGTAVPAEHTAGYPIVTIKDGTGTGEIDTASGTVTIGAYGGSLDFNATQKASINAEVLDVISTDAVAEPASVPAANAPLDEKISWLYMRARNKSETTNSQDKIFADDTTTVRGTSNLTDDGTTFTRGEYA